MSAGGLRITGYDRLSHEEALKLEAAAGRSSLVQVRNAISAVLRHYDKEQHNEGGLMPCILVARVRDLTGLHRSTIYRHKRRLEWLGALSWRLLSRGSRGPGVRAFYRLAHVRWRTWAERVSQLRQGGRPKGRPRRTQLAPAAAQAAERAPPAPDELGPAGPMTRLIEQRRTAK